MKRYSTVKNGEGFEVEPGEKMLLECGDCGCVRQVAFAIEENGRIGVALKVDEQETAARRTMRKVKASIRRVAQGVLGKTLAAAGR